MTSFLVKFQQYVNGMECEMRRTDHVFPFDGAR